MLGYSPEDMDTSQSAWKERVHPEDLPHVLKAFYDHVQDGAPFFEAEYRLKTKDGHWKWVLSKGKVVDHDDEGRPVRVTGTSLDIGQRKKTEDALRNSERRFRTLAEAAPFGISLISTDENIEYVNPKFTRIFGYTLGDMQTQAEWFLAALREVNGGGGLAADSGPADQSQGEVGGPEPGIIKVEGKDGIEKIIGFKSAFLNDYRRIVTCEDVTGRKTAEESLRKAHEELESRVRERTAELKQTNDQLILEITERRQAEEALRWSEAKYRELVQNANSLIARLDPSGNVMFFNEFAQNFFGFAEEEIIGKNAIGTLLSGTDSSDADFANMIRDIDLSPEKCLTIENENTVRNGNRVWLAWTNQAITDSNGEIAEILCVGHDITYRKEAEKQLRRAHNELERRVEERTLELKTANRQLNREIMERKRAESLIKASLEEKEVLLQEIHHRVKNNLQVMSSLLRLQSRHVGRKDVTEVFRDAEHRVRSMALAHEKLYQSSDLANIWLSDYITTLSKHILGSYETDTNRLKLSTDIDGISLPIDSAIPLGLIVSELISNCVKHAFVDGERGEVTVSIRWSGPHEFQLGVRDDGIGIPEHISWDRPDSLGLRLVRLFTRQLRGKIELSVDQGTRFSIGFDLRNLPGNEIRLHDEPEKGSH
ncbi:PAS domain S-box protein [Thermodesulfobacteriota bacterium]